MVSVRLSAVCLSVCPSVRPSRHFEPGVWVEGETRNLFWVHCPAAVNLELFCVEFNYATGIYVGQQAVGLPAAGTAAGIPAGYTVICCCSLLLTQRQQAGWQRVGFN